MRKLPDGRTSRNCCPAGLVITAGVAAARFAIRACSAVTRVTSTFWLLPVRGVTVTVLEA